MHHNNLGLHTSCNDNIEMYNGFPLWRDKDRSTFRLHQSNRSRHIWTTSTPAVKSVPVMKYPGLYAGVRRD